MLTLSYQHNPPVCFPPGIGDKRLQMKKEMLQLH